MLLRRAAEVKPFQAAEKGLQLCSRALEPLNVLLQYALGSSRPAASLAGHFEQPVGL